LISEASLRSTPDHGSPVPRIGEWAAERVVTMVI